jgi:hypothetical protein
MIVIVLIDFVRMAHHHGFSVKLLHLIWVAHLVHAYYLPGVALPKDLMQ